MDTSDMKLIELLFGRDQSVLEKITQKYGLLYKGILRRLLGDEQDVAECENDVLLAVWNSIPPNRPENLSAYISRLARNVGVNKFKYNSREKRNKGFVATLDELAECIPDKTSENDVIENAEQEQIREIVLDFINGLDAETRILFIRRYFYLESVQELAHRYDLSENGASVKLFRARKRLRKILEKEGFVL